MYLKRITINGFKSFATKTTLDLEGGITAIVGPNGSGKSNLADAIRWALGEQSKGRLRLGDREEVVFGGTDRRARSSFAEVALVFDNQDGAFPLALTEVEISRRLYRSGETDYRLGGRSVRLADIQSLLAEAGFGAGSYAVIGQGMIDSFLLSSPGERKMLFDEAAGIRGAELRREASLRKLAATAANLTRLRDISGELAPRLASLERARQAELELEKLEEQLRQLGGELAGARVTELESQIQAATARRDELAAREHRLGHDLRQIKAAQAKRVRAVDQEQSGRAAMQELAANVIGRRERTLVEQAELRTQLSHLQSQLAEAEAYQRSAAAAAKSLAKQSKRLQELIEDLAANQDVVDAAAKSVDRAGREVEKAQAQLVALRQETADGTQQQYVSHALQLVKTIAQMLQDEDATQDQLHLLVHKAGRLLSHASRTGEPQLLDKIRQAQRHLERAMIKRETALEHQTNIVITRRSLEIDHAHQEDMVKGLEIQLETAESKLAKLGQIKVAVAQTAVKVAELDQTAEKLQVQFDDVRAKLQMDRVQEISAEELTRDAARLERLQAEVTMVIAERSEVVSRLRQLQIDLKAGQHELKQSDAVSDQIRASNQSVADLERQAQQLSANINARRAMQQDSAAEYQEVSGRQSEMAAQIADLEQAEADLTQIVAHLDGLIRERFKANFASLSGHFGRYFVRLFGGGSASLELEEAADGSYGIQILATPKGKRVANLSALSGGERALAGVALLAAILNVNPSPFVVLDEIDAALDEANSGRLGDILEELSAKSQLLVITHNRQTMRAAKVLFGVTMNEHHVSRLLSLRLEEASRLAAR